MLDLRRRGLVGRLGLCGVNGKKFPEIRAHMKRCIADTYSNLRDSVLGADGRVAIDTFPADDCVDAQAYLGALRSFSPGDVAVIFTPDSTHFEIAMACVERGLHVFVTKPIVQTLAQHARLASLARSRGVLVAVEVHKRLDPIYADARDKVQQQLGPFSFMHAYMSQPKYQLDTFRSWAGRDSDISYYLNSHHVDFHEWCVGAGARPVSVTALASTGVAEKLVDHKQCEDTITLSVQWEVFPEDGGDGPSSLGSASYTASWVAPRAEVHSQQRFFYMGQRGEVRVDQAHRGYGMAVDSDSVSGAGYKSLNPLFMKYTPSAAGHFSGQQGYGYRSFEAFVEAAARIVRGQNSAEDFSEASGSSVAGSVATVHDTFRTTAILEAGRRSLDSQSTISIVYDPSQKRSILPLDLLVQRQGEQKS
jgi:D-galacturonate reductase